MPAVAITDHGNMYCAWKFMKATAALNHDENGNFVQKVKPIIGCEFYMCENLHNVGYENKEYYHLILLAKTTPATTTCAVLIPLPLWKVSTTSRE